MAAVRTKQVPLRSHTSWGTWGPLEAQDGEGGDPVLGGRGQLGPMFLGRERSWPKTHWGTANRYWPRHLEHLSPHACPSWGALACFDSQCPLPDQGETTRSSGPEAVPQGSPLRRDEDGTRGQAPTRSRLPGTDAGLSSPSATARVTQLGGPCCLNGTKTKGGYEQSAAIAPWVPLPRSGH